ncbi:alpha/beta fold hydrolase [Candidatus Omnitrophota bacterium]
MMRQNKIIKLVLLVTMILTAGIALLSVVKQGDTQQSFEVGKIAISNDNIEINYYEHGQKGPVLVFVHGWSCDATYWREQVNYFKEKYRIILLDLAGHGRSGSERENYTTEAFGQDVKTVVESIKADKVILIGHSMGALVSVEAALLMPDKVIGLVVVDDFQNVEYPLSEKQFEEMVTPFREDFKQAMRGFVGGMLRLDNLQVNEWIISDMSLADPEVAISAINETLGNYLRGDVAKLFDELYIPVIAVNADLWPTDIEANKRHIKDFELIELDGLDHFLMLKSPERFNPALEQAVKTILNR